LPGWFLFGRPWAWARLADEQDRASVQQQQQVQSDDEKKE